MDRFLVVDSEDFFSNEFWSSPTDSTSDPRKECGVEAISLDGVGGAASSSRV